MKTRVLALVGVAASIAVAPLAAHEARPGNSIVLIGAGSALAAFGISAALLGTRAPSLAIPAPSVVYLPPYSYLPPAAAPPVVYAPDLPPRS